MVTRSGQRLALAAVFAACFVTVWASPASAQSSISFSGGAGVSPTQVYAGVAWESPDIAGRFRLRPGIDGGFGDNLRVASVNIDFVGVFQLGTSGWTLLQGGGPAITITKYTGPFDDLPRDLDVGGSYLFGLRHDNGFFGEFRLGGGGNVSQLKVGVGWAVEIK